MRRHPDWQHPITQRVVVSGPSNPLGDRWIGFHHDEYMAIGFHGTNQAQLIGAAISHGCLRMRNEDIRQLYEQISLGTPVTVQP
jgi:lipoprotein-anchoring transpeptidase ErfK/SrfK